MIQSASKTRPKRDRLAAMIEWLRDSSETPWTWTTDRETAEYRIECLYPGGLRGFERDNLR